MKFPGTGKFWAICSIVFLWGMAFALACLLTSSAFYSSIKTDSAWSRIFGSATKLLSADMYEKADNYFHRGVPHHREVFFDDPFQRLAKVVAPSKHMHADGERDKMEIMPWLSLATKTDPHNVEAYQVAIYWLKSADKYNLARKVLHEAIYSNWSDYRLYMELGLVNAQTEQREASLRAFKRAAQLWPSPLSAEDDQAKIDMGLILMHAALLAELNGDYESAINLLKREHLLFPNRKNIPNEIEKLQSGNVKPSEFEKRWKLLQAISHKREAERHKCQRENKHHTDHAEE